MRTGSFRVILALLPVLIVFSRGAVFAQNDAPPAAAGASSSGGAPLGVSDGRAGLGPIRRIGGGVSPPVLTRSVPPQFSEEARQKKLSGTVLVGLIVDRDGLPQNVHLIRGVGVGLDENAIAAVNQYRFTPAMEGGKPVAVLLNVEVNFKIFDKDGVAMPATLQQTTVGAAGGSSAAGYPPPVAVPGCAIDQTPPSDADAALQTRKYADAERLYGVALAADPASGAAMAGLVRTTLAEGKLADALAMAQKYQGAHPNDANVLDALGEVRFRRGEVDEAAMAFNQSSRLGPCNGVTHGDMARFLSLSGMYASAQRQLEFAHALSPNNADITLQWKVSHAVPRTPEQQVASLKQRLESASLTDQRRDAINAAIKGIESNEKGGCELASPVTEAKLPMAPISSLNFPDRVYEVGLGVEINGKKKRLEIDTGASGLVLTSSVAKGAGLVPEVETKVNGIGDSGAAGTFVSHVDDIKIGRMEFKNCQVRVLEPGNQLEKTTDIDGLIGPDVFRDYVVTLDTPGMEVRLGPLPPRPGDQAAKTASLATSDNDAAPVSQAERAKDRYVAAEMKDWTPVFRSSHMLIVPTTIGNAPVKLFIVDSGSAQTLISMDAAREVAQVSGMTAPTVKGLNGEVQKVLVADKVTMGFAGLHQVVGGVTSIDTTAISRGTGVGISGFLGFPTLSELVISIDYRDNLVHMVYNPAKGYHAPSQMIGP
jgi:TonB family protein